MLHVRTWCPFTNSKMWFNCTHLYSKLQMTISSILCACRLSTDAFLLITSPIPPVLQGAQGGVPLFLISQHPRLGWETMSGPRSSSKLCGWVETWTQVSCMLSYIALTCGALAHLLNKNKLMRNALCDHSKFHQQVQQNKLMRIALCDHGKLHQLQQELISVQPLWQPCIVG